MKYLNLLFLAFASLILLNSCQKKPAELKTIPESADFVISLTPSQWQAKSGIQNLSQTEVYQMMVKNYHDSINSHIEAFDSIFQNSKESGIDLDKNIFLFEYSQHNGFVGYSAMSLGLTDAKKFKQMLEKGMYHHADSVEIKTDGDLQILFHKKKNSRAIMAWNSTQAIALMKPKGNVDNESLSSEVKRLFEQNVGKSIANNDDFLDFYEKRKDLNIWFSSDFMLGKLPREYRDALKVQMPFSLQGIYYHWFLDFAAGEASFESELIVPKDLKRFLNKYTIIKNQFDQEMLKYLPKNSFANISFAVNPQEFYRMIKDAYAERQMDISGMQQLVELSYNTNLDSVLGAISGECIINVHDIQLAQKRSEIDSLLQVPTMELKYSVMLKLDDKNTYEWFLENFYSEKKKLTNGYYILNKNKDSNMYISMIDQYIMLTNDEQLISQFVSQTGFNPSLKDSEIGQHLQNYGLYAELNMDSTFLSQEVKNYLDTTQTIHKKAMMKKAFSSIKYIPQNAYHAKLTMEFNDKETNALKQILE
jgi:hypothetical protein